MPAWNRPTYRIDSQGRLIQITPELGGKGKGKGVTADGYQDVKSGRKDGWKCKDAECVADRKAQSRGACFNPPRATHCEH